MHQSLRPISLFLIREQQGYHGPKHEGHRTHPRCADHREDQRLNPCAGPPTGNCEVGTWGSEEVSVDCRQDDTHAECGYGNAAASLHRQALQGKARIGAGCPDEKPGEVAFATRLHRS